MCSTWIGSGVARDLNDLRRVHQLLVSSLAKLNRGSISTQLYNESAATLEKLSILKSWAEVYIVAIDANNRTEGGDGTKLKAREDGRLGLGLAACHCLLLALPYLYYFFKVVCFADEDDTGQSVPSESSNRESLLSLVTPELSALITHWLSALRDYALLNLPNEFSNQLPPEGGAYYTIESADSCRPFYRRCWPTILLAAVTWLRLNNFELRSGNSVCFVVFFAAIW